MHKLAYHVCKEFLRLLPAPLYLGHPHNIHLQFVTSEHFIRWCESVKILCQYVWALYRMFEYLP
jgi:hypothetical protein